MEKRIADIPALANEAQEFIRTLAPAKGATLIALSGELGAGKTTFTQEIAKALGVTDPVTSPTFVLEKIYELPNGMAFERLVHIDAYRLHGPEELQALGFHELMYDPGNLILLEWPERVADALPEASVRITLTPNPDGSRTLAYA